jgi:predicted nucleic acid-binding protein
MILLDTNIVSELFRPRPEASAIEWMELQAPDDLGLCAPVLATLRLGVSILPVGRRKDGLLGALTRLELEFFRSRVFPFDGPAARAYGDVVAERRSLGRPIDTMDAQIAAIARSAGAQIATRNTRDFEGLDLVLVNPFEA